MKEGDGKRGSCVTKLLCLCVCDDLYSYISSVLFSLILHSLVDLIPNSGASLDATIDSQNKQFLFFNWY